MNLMYITNDADIAYYASINGVKRIFVDLEILGKFERQGHLDTVISNHSIEDVGKIRDIVDNDTEILVRINPINDSTNIEIERAIELGADLIMLPMFKHEHEIEKVGRMINGRAGFIPLIETKSAAENLSSYVNSQYISEFYIGLNDLHRDLGLKFMFELLSNGYIDELVNIIKRSNKPFGFGGIACIGDGELPAKLILAEHVRLGSSSVILSRAFHQRARTLTELKEKIDLPHEIKKLNSELEKLRNRNKEQVFSDCAELKNIVNKLLERI